MHDPETGRCHDLMKGQPIRFDDFDQASAWEKVPCTCRQYIGPRPIDQVFMPRILPPEGT
jgi:hypothetical protein